MYCSPLFILIGYYLDVEFELKVLIEVRNAVRLEAKNLSIKMKSVVDELSMNPVPDLLGFFAALKEVIIKCRLELQEASNRNAVSRSKVVTKSNSVTVIGIDFIDAVLAVFDSIGTQAIDDPHFHKKLIIILYQQCDNVRANLKQIGIKLEDN